MNQIHSRPDIEVPTSEVPQPVSSLPSFGWTLVGETRTYDEVTEEPGNHTNKRQNLEVEERESGW